MNENWEDFCLDPFHEALGAGRVEGSDAAAETSFAEGYTHGKITAINYAIEIGFIQGAINILQEDKNLSDRVTKVIRDIQEQLDSFPDPTSIFSTSTPSNHPETESSESKKDDVQSHLQSVQSKFKLLSTLLGLKDFSLQRLIEDASDGIIQTPASTPERFDASDW